MPKTYSDQYLDEARDRGDALADSYLSRTLDASESARTDFYLALNRGGSFLWQFVESTGAELTASIGPVPAWAKPYWRSEAARIFQKRSGDVLLLLGLYSLPYCYAAAKGAAVLAMTGRLSSKGQALTRLHETATFVQTVLSGQPEEIRQACLHVRLIHALVRHHLLKKGWDTATYGIPANQEDMAGTNLAFGFMTVRGLRVLGLGLSPAEAEAYLGWFAVLGTWLGIEPELCPHAQADCMTLGQIIAARHHRPSEDGRALTRALLESFRAPETPGWLAQRAPGLMASLLGPEVTEILDIPGASEASMLSALQRVNTLRSLSPIEPNWLARTPPKRKMNL